MISLYNWMSWVVIPSTMSWTINSLDMQRQKHPVFKVLSCGNQEFFFCFWVLVFWKWQTSAVIQLYCFWELNVVCILTGVLRSTILGTAASHVFFFLELCFNFVVETQQSTKVKWDCIWLGMPNSFPFCAKPFKYIWQMTSFA